MIGDEISTNTPLKPESVTPVENTPTYEVRRFDPTNMQEMTEFEMEMRDFRATTEAKLKNIDKNISDIKDIVDHQVKFLTTACEITMQALADKTTTAEDKMRARHPIETRYGELGMIIFKRIGLFVNDDGTYKDVDPNAIGQGYYDRIFETGLVKYLCQKELEDHDNDEYLNE